VRPLPLCVERAIERFLRRLDEYLGGEYEAYLFGSYARGDWHLGSDVDILVVTPRLANLSRRDRAHIILQLAPPSPRFHVFVYTPEEFRRGLRSDPLLVRESRWWIKLR